ncbi:hypothetical protein HDR58_09420 [bacterium]|nr:hypothetical protein [bacterium]
MKYQNDMITVNEYAESLKSGAYYTSPMLRAEDYAHEIQAQLAEKQKASLITVKDYVKTLKAQRYVTPLEEILEAQIESTIEKKLTKPEKDAQTLERLLG